MPPFCSSKSGQYKSIGTLQNSQHTILSKTDQEGRVTYNWRAGNLARSAVPS